MTSDDALGFCLSGSREDIDNFLVTHGDEIADGVVQREMIVVRDWRNSNFRIARKSVHQCVAGQEHLSPGELQQLVEASARDAGAAANSPFCSVTIPGIGAADAPELFVYLSNSGLRYTSLVTQVDRSDIRAADSCEAIETIGRSFARHQLH